MESAKTLVPDQQRDLLPASRVALEEWQIMMNEVRASRCEEFRLHKLRFDQALAISLLALFAYAGFHCLGFQLHSSTSTIIGLMLSIIVYLFRAAEIHRRMYLTYDSLKTDMLTLYSRAVQCHGHVSDKEIERITSRITEIPKLRLVPIPQWMR